MIFYRFCPLFPQVIIECVLLAKTGKFPTLEHVVNQYIMVLLLSWGAVFQEILNNIFRHCWLSQGGRVLLSISLVKAQNAANHPVMLKIALSTKDYLASNGNCTEAENPYMTPVESDTDRKRGRSLSLRSIRRSRAVKVRK